MEAVIQQIEWALERSDRDINYCTDMVVIAEKTLEQARDRLDEAVAQYEQALDFKDQALQAVEVLRAHEG